MTSELLKISQSFLENFATPLNLREITRDLAEISKTFSKDNSCKCNAKIYFMDKKFSISASMKNNQIYFNKLRIHTFNHLHIDCEDENYMKNIYTFYDNYTKLANHSRFETAFYDFMRDCIEYGYEEDLKKVGSYKYIKYELLETIFHETQHMIQNEEFIKFNNNTNNISQILIIFSVVYEKLYSYLIKNKVKLNFTRENYRYPVEIDARYVALKNLNEIKQKYYVNDINFGKHIINSCIIPNKINVEKMSNQIFLEYQDMYNKYLKISMDNEFSKINDVIMFHKEQLIKEMIARYKNINTIIKLNQSQIF